jgi:hypothetical protein
MAKSRRNMNKMRKRSMKGGNFSEQEKGVLMNTGFTQNQITTLEDLGVTYEQVNQKVNEVMGPNMAGNSDDVSEQVVTDFLNELIFNNPDNINAPIGHAQDDIHNLDDEGLNHSFQSGDDNSLHESDLNTTTDSGYTTNEDESFVAGSKKYKKRKTMKKRKGKKTHKKGRKHNSRTRKQKGGVCYGNGVGANNYDPNFSIYNTRELQLFPYKPQQ